MTAPRLHIQVALFLQNNELMGQGIGFIDAHLLAATAMSAASRVWTLDKRLERVAARLDVAYDQ